MKVIAIKCECCNDGVVPVYCTKTGEFLGEVTCPACGGLCVEYPPEDKKAQKHVEEVKE